MTVLGTGVLESSGVDLVTPRVKSAAQPPSPQRLSSKKKVAAPSGVIL